MELLVRYPKENRHFIVEQERIKNRSLLRTRLHWGAAACFEIAFFVKTDVSAAWSIPHLMMWSNDYGSKCLVGTWFWSKWCKRQNETDNGLDGFLSMIYKSLLFCIYCLAGTKVFMRVFLCWGSRNIFGGGLSSHISDLYIDLNKWKSVEYKEKFSL